MKKVFSAFLTVFVLVGAMTTLHAQSRITVSGVVTDDSHEAVIGAGVLIRGTSIGTVTDIDGNYSIEVPSDAVLEFSAIGLETVAEEVNGRTLINVVLRTDKNLLEGSVVVGYGTQKRGSITGAVAGINSDDLLKTKTENPQNMLTGRVPGLRVWQRSSEPGSYQDNMDIRGLGSPLVVIDGVPRTVEDFQRLTPADIDNVSVLKDAAAAIYGVRGGNGVILVTTKGGKQGETKVNYDGSFTLQTPSNLPRQADAVSAMLIINEQKKNSLTGGAPEFSEEFIESFRNGTRPSTNWNDLVIQNIAPQTQHNVSISGGSEKIQYYVSMGYFYQEGFFKGGNLNYNKYNLRSDVTAEIVRGLKGELGLSAYSDRQHMPFESSEMIIRNWWRQSPIYPAFADPEGTMLNYANIELEDNPVAKIDTDISGYRLNNKKNFSVTGNLEYDFGTLADALQGLKVKAMYSYDYRTDLNTNYRREYYQYAYDEVSGEYKQKVYADWSPSRLEKYQYEKIQSLYQYLLTYNRTFAQKHEVGATLGWEEQSRIGENYGAKGNLVFATPYFTALNPEDQQVSIDAGSGNFYELAYRAVIGRLNYSYDNRYLLEAQFRYDGSSKFAKGHQWGFFPSASAGWRISEEPWFRKSPLSFINMLKIRGSFGVLGDDGSADYEWMSGYNYPAGEINSTGNYNGMNPIYYLGSMVMGVSNKALPNPNLTWFTARTFNVGADFEAWNGLLGITFDYFNRRREGLFAQNSSDLPTVVGAAAPVENVNSDSHMGFELELSHRNRVGDFSYNVKSMLTLTRNKYLTFVGNTKYSNSYDKWRHDNMNNRYQGVLFGYEGVGRYDNWEEIWSYDIYKEKDVLPGDYQYLDWNGDGEINGLDEHPYAFDQTPWMNYSLSFDASWKNFDFSLLLQGSALGSMQYGESQAGIWGQHGGGVLEQHLDRWHPATATNDVYDQTLEWVSGYYGLTGRYPMGNSSFNTVSTDYLRLKSIEIGYTLPKFKFQREVRMRIYANAYNPFTITGVKYVDPEHPGGGEAYGRLYPLNKSYTVGMNLSF